MSSDLDLEEQSESAEAEEPKPTPDPRVTVRMLTRISTIDPELDPFTGKSFFRTSTETCANVSRGGAFVPMRETIAPGRRLLVEIELPGGQQIQTVGRVAWTRATVGSAEPAGTTYQAGIGIEFVSAARDELASLERFVNRRVRRRQEAQDPKPSFAAPDQG